jgi:hypothetical protein
MRSLALSLAAVGVAILTLGQSSCPSNQTSKQGDSGPTVRGLVYNLDSQQRCQVLVLSEGISITVWVEDPRLLGLLQAALHSGQVASLQITRVGEDQVVQQVEIERQPGQPVKQNPNDDLYDVTALVFDANHKVTKATFTGRKGQPELQGTTQNPLMASLLSFAMGAGLGVDYVTIDQGSNEIRRVRLPTETESR